MSKFTVNFTDDQDALLDSMEAAFGCATRAELLRKLMALGLLVKEARENGYTVIVESPDGKVRERIVLL